jgi:hypothetical protein
MRPELVHLTECVARGDWTEASRTAQLVSFPSPPHNPEEIEVWLLDLRKTLLIMKVARADLALSLSRTRAAAEFAAHSCQ